MDFDEINLNDIFILRSRSSKKGTRILNEYGISFKCIEINKNSDCVLLQPVNSNKYKRWINVYSDECFTILSINGRELI